MDAMLHGNYTVKILVIQTIEQSVNMCKRGVNRKGSKILD